ncbi:MAG TPA: MFS transporter [Vicinamibacterales bacterium]|nr:MFS transporter [Vicinamibacterales bacterium]
MSGTARLPTFPVVLAGAAAFIDIYSTQPLLPLLTRIFRASTFEAGLTITAPTVAVAIFAPFIGRLADRLGLRRVIILSVWALTIATALAATSRSLHQLIFWRFVQGVATPGIFASTVAYIHEVWPPSHAGRATAAYMTGTILGGFTGRAVSGLVAAAVSWQLAFVALAVLTGVVAGVLTSWLPHEPAGRSGAHGERGRGSTGHLFRNRRLIATCVVGFSVLFSQVAMFTYVTFHLAAPPYHLSTGALGWLFVTYLVGAVVTPFAGRWIDRYGHRVGIASAMAIGAAGALLTLVPSLPAIVAGLALCATGVFTAQATTSSYIGAVTTQDRALAVGMYSTFYYSGGSTGGALPSVFWATGGWTACVALVVIIQLMGAAIALTQWSAASGNSDFRVQI